LSAAEVDALLGVASEGHSRWQPRSLDAS